MTEATVEPGLRQALRPFSAANLRRARSEARLTISFARRELHSKYRQSALSLFWGIAQPILLVLVYAVVFSQILNVTGGNIPYLSFVVAGIVVWRYFMAGLNQATSFIDRSSVLSKVYFRREVIPLSGCVAALLDLGVGLVAIVGVAWIQGISPSITLVALPLVVAVLLVYTIAIAILLATITVFVRDVAHAMPTISQVLFLASPILYPESQIPSTLKFLGTVNPVAVVAEATRAVSLEGIWPNFDLLMLHLCIGTALLVGSVFYLRSIEDRIVDVV
ncbi:ABC-type polysaccharide/polyol phosphate export system, permease component [Actinobacteria bacterium IMCC26207]|nr:ABC-type polysaccharide/polyol phosphate export system, permease component [Actinobacteria bacterium IMCC26207]